VRLAVLLSLALLAPTAVPAQAPAVPSYLSEPKFKDAVNEARTFMGQHRYDLAIDSYQKASKLADDKDSEVLREMSAAQIMRSKWPEFLATNDQMIAIASNPVAKSNAETLRGQALLEKAAEEKYTPTSLHTVDDALKKAIADEPKNGVALYLDGQTLARLGDMDAAKQRFTACVAVTRPTDASYLRVKRYAADPSLVTKRTLPPLVLPTMDNKTFNLDAMVGKVVLINFWTTTCGACTADVQNLKKIAQEYAGKPLVMLSIDGDQDAAVWRDYVTKNGMDWPQVHDANGRVGHLLGVNSIPHYYLIDASGVLQAELSSANPSMQEQLKTLVDHASPVSLHNIQ
jgi:thiol-disulfide isomerase/thioredoxin